MSIIKRTFDYEILLRLSADGLTGAHSVSVTEIVDDESGEVFSTYINDPVSLSTREGEGGRELSEILGAAVARTILENEEMARYAEERDERIKELELLIDDLRGDLEAAISNQPKYESTPEQEPDQPIT